MHDGILWTVLLFPLFLKTKEVDDPCIHSLKYEAMLYCEMTALRNLKTATFHFQLELIFLYNSQGPSSDPVPQRDGLTPQQQQ
jgi:hypothetical protein